MFSFFKGRKFLDHITGNLGNNKKQASVVQANKVII